MLITIEGLLDADELQRVRALLGKTKWASGLTTAGSQAALVKNNQQVAHDDPQLPELRHIVNSALQRSPTFHSATLPLKAQALFFNRHADTTNAYGLHIDNAMRTNADGSYIRTDVSCTLFLSDPDRYEGGELAIEEALGRRSIKLKAGSMVIYPSCYLHEVTPVTSGERLACFMFIQSMVRSPEQRRILFEMDQAVSGLKQRHGVSSEISVLTGAYHNLLRLWADS
jgi:PKHD-type hydroxylase